MKHLLTGEELSGNDIEKLISCALQLKLERRSNKMRQNFQGKHLAMLFDKPSLRTRMSFTVAMRELGGDVIESGDATRKKEVPKDYARVISGYCHALMVRTYEDSILQQMAAINCIPIINGLTNLHHPCQILADLMTLYENFHCLTGLTLCYIGDGNNILHSLLLLAPKIGVRIHYCCPKSRGPQFDIVQKSLKQNPDAIKKFTNPMHAVKNADAIYTDVWTSMGFELQAAEDLFHDMQVNEALMAKAKPNAIFMHCLPMERGKEVSDTLPDMPCSVIFQQSANRLHIQKAILLWLLTSEE
jgi:ornithine carbamoyltransferase